MSTPRRSSTASGPEISTGTNENSCPNYSDGKHRPAMVLDLYEGRWLYACPCGCEPTVDVP